MSNVFKRAGNNGKGRWCIRYQDPNGQDIRKATKAKTKREAELILAGVLKDISSNIYEIKQNQRKVMFFEICEDFLNYGKGHKRSWHDDVCSIKHLKSFFTDCLAMSIKPSLIEEYILKRKKDITHKRRHPKPATINRELACLKTIFNRAIQNGKCERNPMSCIKFLKENNKRDRVLSREEFQSLLDVSPSHLKPILITAYETGMRAGEIFSLAWEQVDLEQGFITLKAEQTKTNEGRKIPISQWLYATLSGIQEKEGNVFLYNGKSVRSVKRSFKQACKKAGIENFRFHDLRHTFVTNMRKAGKQDRVIMAITGHKTMSMLTRYDTVDEDDLRKAVSDLKVQNSGANLAHLSNEVNDVVNSLAV